MKPKNQTAGFSPLYINDDLLQDGKAAALLKFSRIFFPQLGPSVLGLLMDMEGHSSRLIAGIEPAERDRLARELEGVSVELRYTIRDGGREMLSLPITLSPAEVLKTPRLAVRRNASRSCRRKWTLCCCLSWRRNLKKKSGRPWKVS